MENEPTAIPAPLEPDVIPLITHPLGRAWRQPNRDSIVIDGKHALMSKDTLDQLSEYSTSIPSGVYEGKMWKRRGPGHWLLCWYDKSDKPDCCDIRHRHVLLV